ncbi:MAG TPA: M48 family metalloprotease [Microvirga sp.]|nr:M48 family metalloprotease [Microvirga sp.]
MAAALSGCSMFGADAPPLPPAAPRLAGAASQNDRDHAKLVAAFGGEVRAPAAQRLLAEVTARLVAASERPDEVYQVTILNSPVVNAFALPTGRLYVTRGLLALANDTAEVAAVLSHEIAHVALRHASQRGELEARSALITQVTEDVLKNPAEAAVVRDRSRFVLASFSRSQELEADEAGVKVLARAGFDPFGAPRFLTALGRSGGGTDQNRPTLSDMLDTHPSTAERISQALQAARRASAPGIGESDRARYLATLDGLAYGDDPSDGLVRGRRFIHGRLGVAFEAPDDLALENTAEAVLGASPNGNRRLLFDAAATPGGQSLEEVLRTTWSDTIEPGSLEATTVNGLPVATAQSHGKEWWFRLAAIRIGATTFRLIVATRAGSGDLEALFRRTLASVRVVTPAEARALQPLRLHVVTARAGDTAEGFAGRMAVDRGLERFLLLNGLERAGPLTAGQPYKLVIE